VAGRPSDRGPALCRRRRLVPGDDRQPRSNAQVVETARQGVGILGPGTPAAARLENIARFLDFVGENITRAAEQAREVLYTKAEATSPSSSPTPRPLSATEPPHNGRTPPPPPTGLA